MTKAQWREPIQGVYAIEIGDAEICVTKSSEGPWVAYKPHDSLAMAMCGVRPPYKVLKAKTLDEAKNEAIQIVRDSLEQSLVAALPESPSNTRS